MLAPRAAGMSSAAKGLLIGCACLAALALLVVGGCVAWIMMTPEGGVKLPNQMHQYALDYIQKHKMMGPDEKLLAYYDATMSMNGAEAVLLTNENVVYHKEGRNTVIRLSDVESISHEYEPFIGDVIQIDAREGQRMKIEIAPMNDGELFLRALERARNERQSRAAEPQTNPAVPEPTPVAPAAHERPDADLQAQATE
jgi:hypothetical protein